MLEFGPITEKSAEPRGLNDQMTSSGATGGRASEMMKVSWRVPFRTAGSMLFSDSTGGAEQRGRGREGEGGKERERGN